MDIRQFKLTAGQDLTAWDLAGMDPQLLLAFGSVSLLADTALASAVAAALPNASLVGCSTAGEITAAGVSDDTCILTAVRFERVRHRIAEATIPAMTDSRRAGESLGRQLVAPDLAAILVFGKGLDVNGSALIEGLTNEVGRSIPISGGLAGDGGSFKETLVLGPSGARPDTAVAIGIYGADLRIGHGSFGGWVPFGPARKVTRCEGNILYELDGLPALDLYRQYLGDYAKNLPASGLLFPFEMLDQHHGSVGLIRTILGVDAEEGAVILAGDIDPDGYLRLMHASTDNLVDGAEQAARQTVQAIGFQPGCGLAILVSCVGRKLVMGDNVDEEVEAVATVLGRHATLTGFYSYGEIAPFSPALDCKLHNQTMTVTFLSES